ncbi:2-C-methyl-D-erythritol 4-phosphate cytidylyltransferase [Clostridium sp.]|mgnify:CR=1 FL=1|uniref:2-C-methyl-D-erythritol 4-phosphate cytidylyltransferase n=1 Tax=Clostridium sp. TaxID=1506 RepID=UPI0039963B7E
MKNIAIILAGGKGKRMGADISKQFLTINSKPIICYTIEAFQKSDLIDEIIVVLPKDEIDYFNKDVLGKYDLNISKIVEGGKERQDSVYNALQSIKNCNIVLIHDGARPLVSKEIIEKGISYAEMYSAAAPGVMPKDTIKVINSKRISKETLVRNNLVAVQTPQCFKYSLIKECHSKIRENNIEVTDDTMVVETYGNEVYIYEGDYENIKVTTKEDLILVKALL